MSRFALKSLLTLALVFGATFPGGAEALRCGQRLVSPGDRAAEVLKRCGRPQRIDERYETRAADVHDRYRRYDDRRRYPAARIEVHIETWLYNFGPRRFMRELRFENGELKRIESLGYGH